MQKRLLALSLKASILAAALAALPIWALAAGLGKITVLSALGQPLRAEVELTASREELSSISARLGSHDAFKQAGIEFAPALSGVKVVVDRRSGGQPLIRLASERPVNEPFLDLLIELSWASGRLVREYTFLLDPPPEVLAQRPAAPVTPPAAKGEPPAQPEVAPKQRETAARIDGELLAKPREQATPAETAPPGGLQTREVKRGDTLRKIAGETRHEGVSLDQMLLAIFRSNKDAFIGDNMHRMKAGKILDIPEREAAASEDAADARRVIAAQTADFNAYRRKLAAAAAGADAPQEDAARQAVTGKITAKVEDKAPAPAEAKDQLRVSKTESGKEAQGKIAALEEDIVAKDRALKEAQSRQAELEKNLSELQKLVALKNQNLAELQKQAAAKPAATPEGKTPEVPLAAPAAAPAAPAPEAVKPAVPAAADKLAEGAKPAAGPKPAAAPSPAPKKAEPLPEPGIVEELMDTPAALGGGVLLLGLLGLLAFRQRQKHKQQDGEATSTTAASLAANSVFGKTGGQSVDTSASSLATDFSQASIGAIDADEGVDPVAEADVYMAYGRDAQAEEILLDALKSDPTRTAIHVKLLEIYSARKNSKQFETLASDLYAQTGGVGADWEKAAAMGQKLDSANPLYGGVAAAQRRQSISTDTTVIVPAAEMAQIAKAAEQGAMTAPRDRPAEAPALAEPAGAASLDFDLDLGAPTAAAVPVARTRPAGRQAEASADLDFDLGIDVRPQAGKARDDYTPEGTMIMDVTKLAEAPADLALDLKLGEEPAPAATATGEDLHLDLDLGEAAAPAPSAQVVGLDKKPAGDGEGGPDFDFDLGIPPQQPAPPPVPSFDLGSISLDLGESAALAANDEAATKIELAKAYEEMGDKEGARELLQEVLKEGNAEQQEKARGMLGKLS